VTAVPGQVIPIKSFAKLLDGIPVDPTMAELNDHDEFPIAVYVTLAKENVVVPAVVAIHSNNHSILIRFGTGEYVAFDKRRQEAARFVMQQPVATFTSASPIN
jgi:hypothetical protein